MASGWLLARRRVWVRGVATTLWLHLSLLRWRIAAVGGLWLLDSIGIAEVNVGVFCSRPPGFISPYWLLHRPLWAPGVRLLARAVVRAALVEYFAVFQVLAYFVFSLADVLVVLFGGVLEVYVLVVFYFEGDAGHLGLSVVKTARRIRSMLSSVF